MSQYYIFHIKAHVGLYVFRSADVNKNATSFEDTPFLNL